MYSFLCTGYVTKSLVAVIKLLTKKPKPDTVKLEANMKSSLYLQNPKVTIKAVKLTLA